MINRNRGKEAYNIPYVMNIRVLGLAPDARKIGNNAYNASRSGKPKFPKKCSRKSGIMPPKFSRAEFSGILVVAIIKRGAGWRRVAQRAGAAN